jgi:hypothetical protein
MMPTRSTRRGCLDCICRELLLSCPVSPARTDSQTMARRRAQRVASGSHLQRDGKRERRTVPCREDRCFPLRGRSSSSIFIPTKDLKVSTAARLSATFPYASPLARASDGPVKTAYHVGDGGYYDNSGLLSAVEWLDEARGKLEGYKVLLILIDAKPGAAKDGSSWSWQRQLGPIHTLLNVRSSSQKVRESIELKMALEYLTTATPDANEAARARLEVIPESFLFWSPSDPDPPLSWHSTDSQKKEIGGAWANPTNRNSWQDVRSKLGCLVDKEILKKPQVDE